MHTAVVSSMFLRMVYKHTLIFYRYNMSRLNAPAAMRLHTSGLKCKLVGLERYLQALLLSYALRDAGESTKIIAKNL